jgi:hypothetical protein
MTDCDQAQIAALKEAYPQSRIFLCRWHVIHAMWSHLCTENFPELWEKIQKWVKTDNQAKHDQIWNEIESDPTVPPSVQEYLRDNWKPVSHMWATVAQKD